MIGVWYSRQPLTNHKQPLPTQMIPERVALKAHTQSPNSFWSGEIRDITLDLAVKMEGELIKCLKLLLWFVRLNSNDMDRAVIGLSGFYY